MNQLQQRTSNNKTTLAVLVLSICCVFWGFSFPAMQHVVASFERHVPLAHLGARSSLKAVVAISASVIGLRFLVSSLVYGVLSFRKQSSLGASAIRGGFLIGFFFATGVYAQIIGLRYTKPSISAFLTALGVLFAPISQWCFFKQAVSKRVWVAVGVAVAGVITLSLPAAAPVTTALFSRPPLPYLGEFLTVICSLLFTCQILTIDKLSKTLDPYQMTFVMFLSASLFNLALALPLLPEAFSPSVISSLAGDWTFVWSFLSLTVFCTVVAMHLMNMFQPFVSPTVACIIYCLEPVFATFFSIALGNESFCLNLIGGGGLILIAVMLSSNLMDSIFAVKTHS